MAEPQEENEQSNEGEPQPIDELFKSPDVQKGIGKFIEQLATLIQNGMASGVEKATIKAEEQRRSTRWTSTTIIIVTAIIIAAVSILAWNESLSSEAVAFLFGTIIGTVFGVLGRFFGSKN